MDTNTKIWSKSSQVWNISDSEFVFVDRNTFWPCLPIGHCGPPDDHTSMCHMYHRLLFNMLKWVDHTFTKSRLNLVSCFHKVFRFIW